jgi:SAM-dependent methyltransferase
MIAAFDHIATEYDGHFTNTLIGKTQRQLVLQYLKPLLLQQENIAVLELNCGTGEDAKWIAQHGATVVATDISLSMIQQAEAKIEAAALTQKVICKQLDINSMQELTGIDKFDLIFSNFGGLNCIAPKKLHELLQNQLPSLLNKNGSMIFVMMPKFCLWESLYHTIIFKWKNVFRRLTNNAVIASVGNGVSIKTWYYNPNWLKQHLPANSTVQKVIPVGFFIPPSYLNHFVAKRPKLFALLNKLELKVSKYSFLASASDHYLIHLKK